MNDILALIDKKLGSQTPIREEKKKEPKDQKREIFKGPEFKPPKRTGPTVGQTATKPKYSHFHGVLPIGGHDGGGVEQPKGHEKEAPFFDGQDKRIQGILNSHFSYEIEISIGRFTEKGFIPGVTFGEFQNLRTKLEKDMKAWGKSHSSHKTYQDSVYIDPKVHIRKIVTTSRVVWEQKFRQKSDQVENRYWGFRMSKSSEKLVDSPKDFSPTIVRHRTRETFQILDPRSEFYGVRFDLTHVRQDTIKNEVLRGATLNVGSRSDFKGDPNQTRITYEVEIERVSMIASTTEIPLQTYENAVKFVLMGLQNITSSSDILSQNERKEAVKFHNSLFVNDKTYKPSSGIMAPYILFRGYWNKPENLGVDDMLFPNNDYSVTVKLDGVRKLVLLTQTTAYICGPPDEISKRSLSKNVENFVPTLSRRRDFENFALLDCEEYDSKFYVFDILFYKGKDIRQNLFSERYDMIEKILASGTSADLFIAKKFHHGKDFYESTELAYEEMQKTKMNTDGLIFQPRGDVYRNKTTRKWKPSEKLTIDFKLISGKEKGTYILNVYDTTQKKDVQFMGSNENGVEEPFIVTTENNWIEGFNPEGLNPEGLIVEVRFENLEPVIVRTRQDRGGQSNSLEVAQNVWNDIVDPLSPDDILGKTLITMRRFHNLFKMSMLSSSLKKGNKIMDWGSGRGGDLAKWFKIGLSDVYVVEPNKDNLAIFEDRLQWFEGNTKIHFARDGKTLFGGQNTKDLQKVVGDTKLDAIVSFFSLTFFGKDDKILSSGVQTISELLPVGGKFIGIVMDGDRVAKSLGKSGKIVTDAFYIKKVSEISVPKSRRDFETNEIEVSINDPDAMVKEQREWLFYFDLFTKKLEKHNIVLKIEGFIDKSSSSDFNITIGNKKYASNEIFAMLPKGGKAFSELNRYFVFEKVSGKPSVEAKKSSVKTSKPAAKTPTKISNVNKCISLVLEALNEETPSKSLIEKTRKLMGTKLKREVYDILAGGCVAKSELVGACMELYDTSDLEELNEEEIEEAEKLAFMQYQLKIADPEEQLSDSICFEILSSLYKIEISVSKGSKVIKYGKGKKISIRI